MSTSQNKSIILIDDDPVNNFINTKVIEMSFTFNIIAFTNACEALRELSEWSISKKGEFPEAIFLDINMPQMDGWEFLEEFQHLPQPLLEKCSVIMLTSSIDTEDIAKSKKYKVVREFISKPLTVEKLKNLAPALL